MKWVAIIAVVMIVIVIGLVLFSYLTTSSKESEGSPQEVAGSPGSYPGQYEKTEMEKLDEEEEQKRKQDCAYNLNLPLKNEAARQRFNQILREKGEACYGPAKTVHRPNVIDRRAGRCRKRSQCPQFT
jgi:flagellar basal body-associated protein FliL